MKKISAFLFMILLIAAFNACDDDSSSKKTTTQTYDLRFEVPTDVNGITADDIAVYSLNKNTTPWTLPQVDADPDTAGTQTFKGYPLSTSIVTTGTDATDGITSIDEYDIVDELETEDIYKTFGYRMIGSDGYTSLSDSSPDLTWDVFKTGYLYWGLDEADNPRAWFPCFGDPTYPGFESPSGEDGGDWNGKYMMKMFTFVELRRMIQIINNDADATTTNITLVDYTSQSITYTHHDEETSNEVIPMTDVLTTDINADIASKYFVITAADGWVNDDSLGFYANGDPDNTNTYDWAAMQQAYIVTNIEDAGTTDENPCSKGKIIFVDSSDQTEPYKSVKFATTIEIVDSVPPNLP